MHVLLTTPGMHMWAVFGATICRANNAIVYAHDSGWIFKNIFGNFRLSIPDPSLAFISKMQAELETRFSNETVARVIVIKWLSFYLMKTIKVKCLLRWAFKVTYYATLLRTNIRRKQVCAARDGASCGSAESRKWAYARRSSGWPGSGDLERRGLGGVPAFLKRSHGKPILW